MTDGFLSRSSLFELLKVKPKRRIIAKNLSVLGIDKLAAVLVAHSHYDHVMDSPEVARRTGATLLDLNQLPMWAVAGSYRNIKSRSYSQVCRWRLAILLSLVFLLYTLMD